MERFLVGLVVGTSDDLLVEICHFIGLAVRVRVLAEDDSLSEGLVISSTTIAIIRLLVQVIDAGSGVA